MFKNFNFLLTFIRSIMYRLRYFIFYLPARRRNRMKNKIFLFSTCLLLGCFTIINASPMQVTWSGTIGFWEGDLFHLAEGDVVVVNAVYDDTSIAAHIYSDGINGIPEYGKGDDVLSQTISDTSKWPILSDANLSYSDNLQAFLDKSVGVQDENYAMVNDTVSGYFTTTAKYEATKIELHSGNTGILGSSISIGDPLGKMNSLWFSELSYTITPYAPGQTPVPEPTTILLFGLGIVGLAGISRKKK